MSEPLTARFLHAARNSIRDIVLIVTSILIAFALDAWWDSARARTEELRYLRGLESEFSTNRVSLQDDLAQLHEVNGALVTLLGLMGPEPAPLAPDSLAALFDRSFDFGLLEMPMGTTQALLASGDLRLISDEELKARLAAWPSEVARARNNTELLVETREVLIETLNPLMPTLSIARHTGSLSDYRDTRFATDAGPILASVQIEGLLGNRAIRVINTRDDYRRLLSLGDTILSVLAEELGVRSTP